MRVSLPNTTAILALFMGGSLADLTNSGVVPKEQLNMTEGSVEAAANFNCDYRVARLNKGDCKYIRKIGFSDQGVNALQRGPGAWIGNDGPYTFKFTNRADSPGPVGVILVLWLMNGERDYQASFVNARRPIITVSLPNQGDSVDISLAEGQIGAWAAVNNHATYLTQYGQISNTWGEFNTKINGNTFDISKEVDMNGNDMVIRANNGCLADKNTCVFKCVNGARSCGNYGEYQIFNCGPPNPGAQSSPDRANGGCSGWGNNGHGHLDVELKRY